MKYLWKNIFGVSKSIFGCCHITDKQIVCLLLTRKQNQIKILLLFAGGVEGHHLAAAASFALD